MPMYRRRRVMRRRPLRARLGRKRRVMNKAKSALHAPKKFVCEYKVMDVVSDISGANVGTWQRNNLVLKWTNLPLHTELESLFKQYAFTGIQFKYRPTNVSPTDAQPATAVLFVEDKDTTTALTYDQAISQDNCRQLTTARGFKHYIKYPRPQLYQSDGTNNVYTIQSSRQLQWFETGTDINHLSAQMLIQDQKNTKANYIQGELWAKVYIVVKEQCKN